MHRWLLVTLVLSLAALPALADDKKPADKKDGDAKAPARPGELTPEEEDKLDKIIDRFIEYDIGKSSDKNALKELEDLGPEAIPALIRGLNKSALMSHSCPVATIYKKLRSLLRTIDDDRTLRFARENIGAGVPRTPYTSLLNDLKMTCILRTRKLEEQRRAAGLKGDIPGAVDPYAPAGIRLPSPGEKSNVKDSPKPAKEPDPIPPEGIRLKKPGEKTTPGEEKKP